MSVQKEHETSCEDSALSNLESLWVTGELGVCFNWGYNIVYVPWDVEEYYRECVKGGTKEREKNLHKFPCPSLGSHTDPLTIVDGRGRIVLWYLPGLLSIQHQVSLYDHNAFWEFKHLCSLHYDMEPSTSHSCYRHRWRKRFQECPPQTGRCIRSTLLSNIRPGSANPER